MPRGLVLLLLLFVLSSAPAAESTLIAPGWVLDRWTVEDGLPLNHLNDVTLDGSGQVWLATFEGLVRFDGIRFTTMGPGHPLGVPAIRLGAVAVHPRDGALWILDESHQLHRRNGLDLQTFADPALRTVREQGVDLARGDDALWVQVTGGLARLEEAPRIIPAPLDSFRRLVPAPGGRLWVVDEEVWEWSPGGADGHWGRLPDPPAGLLHANRTTTDAALAFAVEGRDSVQWSADLQQYVDGDPIAHWSSAPRPTPWTILDRTVCHDGQTLYPLSHGIKGAAEGAGGLWVVTEGDGLTRFRRAAITTHRPPDGQESNITRLWWDEAQQVLWAQGRPQGWWPLAGEPMAPLPDPLGADEESCRYWTSRFFDDPQERRWLACGDSLYRWEGQGWSERIPARFKEPGPAMLWGGAVWLGGALLQVLRGEVLSTPQASGEGIESALSFLPWSDGSLLIGAAGEVWRVEPGSEALTSVLTDERLGLVRHLRADGERLWLSTVAQGLCAVTIGANERPMPRCLDAEALDGRSTVHASLDDGRGRVWISSNRGIGVVDARALEGFAEGGEVPSILWLGAADGMRKEEANGFLGDAAVRTPDGRLWFATQDGVAEIDPARFALPEPPAVLLLSATLGEQEIPLPASIALPTAHPPLRLEWSTAAMPWARQVSFRYRLSSDHAWSAPSTERSLTLPSLPAGDSALEIQGRLGGSWGPVASLPISRVPALHERAFFPLLLGLLGVLGIAGGLGIRSALLARINRQLAAQVQAQTRELAAQNDKLNQSNAALSGLNQRLIQSRRELQVRNEQIAKHAEQLQEADRLKRQFVANISHELRTPLALIIGPLGTLEGATPPDSQDARHLRLARESAQRLEELIGQLFDLSRAQAGGIALRARRVELRGHLRELRERFAPAAATGAVRLALEAPSPVAAWVDRDCIDKAIYNLLANALRFSPPGGTVTLRLRAEGDAARIEVEDEGPGVPPEHREAIFERFFQLDESADRVREGAGLGLALVKEFIALHGGEVRAEGGQIGARFVLSLPLGVAHLAPEDIDLTPPMPTPRPLPQDTPPESGNIDGARVLLVEDHPQMRQYLAESLGERFQVTAAANGIEAVGLLEEQAFALLISDVMMPGMDGHALVRHIRSRPELADLPVLLVSARQELSDRVAGLELADDYLAKPFQVPELLARAAALLRRRPAPTEEGPAEAPAPTRAERFEASLAAAADPRLADESFGAGALARAMAMSPRTLQIHMRDLDLPTPVTWLRSRRLDLARRLLRSGEVDTVAEAAAAVGMSAPYLSRIYTAHFGHNPRQDL